MRRKKKSNHLILPLFIIILMISSAVTFSLFGKQPSPYNYNNFEFKLYGDKFQAKINGEYRTFFFHPTQLQDLVSGIGTLNYSNYIIIVGNVSSEDEPAVKQLSLSLAGDISTISENIFAEISETITCEDSTSQYGVISLGLGENSSIKHNKNCIEIVASNRYDLLRMKELFLYTLFGII